MFTYLSCKTENKIATISLNRPEKRNALNAALVEELYKAFIDAADDGNCKVVILTAEGSVFSAGADLEYLQQLQKNSYEENLSDSRRLASLFKLIYSFPKPVIACVQGHAIAGGCGLATVCDFIFAVPEAQFGYTEVKIGFIPAIVTVFLLRKISGTHAAELLLTGKLISAEEAKIIGLINGIYPAGEIKEKVYTFATELCSQTSRTSLQMTKQLLAETKDMKLDDALEYAAIMNAKARGTEDCKYGIQSFLDKKKPEWD